MQLDTTRIPIRERSYLNLLDLSLTVVREHALPLLLLSILGAVPFAVLNYFLLAHLAPAADAGDSPDQVMEFVMWTVYLVMWELPLASIPVTLFLSQALFLEKPNYGRMARTFFSMLPQIILIQAVLRGLVALAFVSCTQWTLVLAWPVMWWLMFWVWPFMTEVILLERNPLTRRGGRMSTFARASNLHKHHRGDLFSRWLLGTGIGVLWTAALWLTIIWVRVQTSQGVWRWDAAVYSLWLPVAMWVVISYFHVVRFLSYLDLRIRSEGWEIELRMRAEANRLRTQLS